MNTGRPEILIGFFEAGESCKMKISEISYGIEEEGCLSGIYEMGSVSDIRYTSTEAAVIVTGDTGSLFAGELGRNHCLYSTDAEFPENCRILGKNAARYIKKLKLKGI